ncbi:PP2C family protein-serine/threonine phosphatase [Flexithrix dorotheae]|uniref:PP2C family protein-serine/threonine phosphatase n=1 Tax=Flexithrix dorotheae TaxID=70993 RepID=UPI00037C9EB2|nr:PP2C family protein-serine/threonine phosphatase [Flexithrix dorotheae]
MALTVETKLEIKELELKSLFETIRAINSNSSERDLFKIYKFIIRSNPNINKLALYVLDEEWNCKTYFGTENDYSNIPLDEKLLEITGIGEYTKGVEFFEEFQKVIPIKHKQTVLAYAFLSGSENVEDEDILELDFIDALSNIILVAVENKKLARKEQKQQEYKKQLDIAKDVQSLLFPKELPYNDDLKIMASYLPHHTIGGDYYDYIPINENKFLICIADVSGKGVPAAILMSNFQAALRILTRRTDDLKIIVGELNQLVMQNSYGENFITAFFALYDKESRKFNFINAGHNPPFLFMNNKVNVLNEGTTILGGFKDLPFLNMGSFEELSNFLIFCFTDGFIETYDENGEEFGEEYLMKFLQENLGLDQKDIHSKLISLLNTFKGKNAYVDDITLLSCKVSSSKNN